MRVWMIWPQPTPTALLQVIESVGGMIVRTDSYLDQAESEATSVEADVVLINSLTPGTQDVAAWIVRRRFERGDLRWIVAFPGLNTHPTVHAWLDQLLRASVFDWVFEGPDFLAHLRDRLTTPWEWDDAAKILGGPQSFGRWQETPRSTASSSAPSSDPTSSPGSKPAAPKRFRWSLKRPRVLTPEPSISTPPESGHAPEIVTVDHETFVERRVPITNRSVLIAVWGAVPGTGATTLSGALGCFLSAYGPTTVLDHAPMARRGAWVSEGRTGLDLWAARQALPPDLTVELTRWEEQPAHDGDRVMPPNWREAVQRRQWSYIVVDAGLAPTQPEEAELAITADLNLLLLPAFQRMQGCWAWTDRRIQEQRRITTAVLGVDQGQAIRESHPEATIVDLPWPHEAGHEAAIETWLAAVLPDEPHAVRRARQRQRWRQRITVGSIWFVVLGSLALVSIRAWPWLHPWLAPILSRLHQR